MAKCEHHEICGRDALEGPGKPLCILHSDEPEKDRDFFNEALVEHRNGKRGNDFSRFVFPGDVDFTHETFTEWTSFFYARFTQMADFSQARFEKGANFSDAKFIEFSDFFEATFLEGAKFSDAEFTQWADFRLAKFSDWALFIKTTFSEGASFGSAEFVKPPDFSYADFLADADFVGAMFARGADFSGTNFSKGVEFHRAWFMGPTLFLPRDEKEGTIPIFSGTGVSFREVTIAPLEALVFRDADLQKCFFVGTDLRKAEFTGVKWPEIIRTGWLAIGSRLGVYDEIEAEQKGETRNYTQIEQLYRQLKQNYEDRRDYERAGDFHYSEKAMRLKNPNTSWGLWFWLTLYWLISGYGERWVRPLLWAGVVLVGSTLSYLWWGLLRVKDSGPILDCTRIWETGLYSLRAMILLKPSNFEPVGFWGDFVYTFQSIVGPLLIGLFALAVRQRLKR